MSNLPTRWLIEHLIQRLKLHKIKMIFKKDRQEKDLEISTILEGYHRKSSYNKGHRTTLRSKRLMLPGYAQEIY
jgi:hypothetical protein